MIVVLEHLGGDGTEYVGSETGAVTQVEVTGIGPQGPPGFPTQWRKSSTHLQSRPADPNLAAEDGWEDVIPLSDLRGEDGSSMATEHIMPVSDVWEVEHDFPYPPNVILINSAGDSFGAAINHSPGKVTITMTPASQGGTVILRG